MATYISPVDQYAIDARREQLKKATIWYYPVRTEKEGDAFAIRAPKGSRPLDTVHRDGKWTVSVEITDPLGEYESLYFIILNEHNHNAQYREKQSRYIGPVGRVKEYVSSGLYLHYAQAGHQQVVRNLFRRY